jgi:putative PIN family toxin of toxin-antitoxin system
MRAVIDTNLLVSAMISRPGSKSRQLLEAIRDGRLTLILSRPLIDEFIDVMGRPKFARYGITIGDMLDFMEGLLAVASFVQITGSARVDDPDDDDVIETAEVGTADYLITGDSDLLDTRIRASLGRIGIEVITASDFLRGSLASSASCAIDQARTIVAICLALPLPKLAHSFGQVTLGVRCFGASASVALLASVALKLIKPDGTEIDIDPNIGYLPAPRGD